jgi:histidine decarboxylase
MISDTGDGFALDLQAAVDLTNTRIDVAAVFQTLLEHAEQTAPTNIGKPGAVDIDYEPALVLFRRLFNNVGDPGTDGDGAAHTKPLERAVIDWCADLLGLPTGDRWGYVTAGGTEGNLAALHAAHHRFVDRRQRPGRPGGDGPRPTDPLVYHSRETHYSIAKIVDIIGAEAVVVDVDDRGEMDYEHLSELVAAHRDRPAIVIATAGTTMTEAVDSTVRINTILGRHQVRHRHLHVDAALSGFPLALDGALQFNATSGVDSIAVSGHKFFGTPIPCGVVLMRDSIRKQGVHIAYTAAPDTTVSGSRCGQAAALIWYAIAMYGADGHRGRAAGARELAAYTANRLTEIGWPAWRNPDAFTVVLRTPPEAITRKWMLSTGEDADWCHTVCMPGISYAQMDAFVSDLATADRHG